MGMELIQFERASMRKGDLCRVYIDGFRHEILLMECIVVRDKDGYVSNLSLDFESPSNKLGKLKNK